MTMEDWTWQEALRAHEARAGQRPPDAQLLLPGLRRHVLADQEAAFHAGDACSRVFIVRSGLLKQQYIDDQGRPTIKSFALPGELFACPFALQPGGVCSFASVAIGPAVVESLDFRAVEALAARELAWQALLRQAFQRLSELKVERERDLLMLSAEDLVRRLMETRPQLFDLVPQKDLAAYFGLTPVGLNRILRRLRTAHEGVNA